MTPLLARIYPNGLADVNQFEAAGGMPFVIGQLLDAGLAHADVLTVAGEGGLERYRQRPRLEGDTLVWGAGAAAERRHRDRPPGRRAVLAPRAGSSCCAAISAAA